MPSLSLKRFMALATRFYPIASFAVLSFLVSRGDAGAANAPRPNLLLITADDMNWNSVGAYGCAVPDITPNIDSLARAGMRFLQAHVTVAVCAPSRSCMMTGLYPHQSGASGFGGIRPGVKTLSGLLADAGYHVGIIDKVGHLQPVDRYRWDFIRDRLETGNGRNPGLYRRHFSDFLREAAAAGKPFFMMANSRDPHRPFAGSVQEKQYLEAPRNKDEESFRDPRAVRDMVAPSRSYEAAETGVPGFLPPVPEIHDEVSDYYSSVRRCDDTVGAILHALDEAGQAANTLVIFLSDNGMPFPFAKFSCYLNGTRTPLFARWPGKINGDSVDDRHVVAGIDLAPTFLEAAGVQIPPEMEGRSILPLLAGQPQSDRDRVFTAFYSSALDEDVPTRAVQERQYGYIFNRWADGASQAQDETYKGLALRAMIAEAARDPAVAQRVTFFLFRTYEELYDFSNDPDGLHNLADSPMHARTATRLRGELLGWMERTGDPLAADFRSFLAGTLGDFSGPKNP